MEYAKWLRDNGDPLRAEFIEIQCSAPEAQAFSIGLKLPRDSENLPVVFNNPRNKPVIVGNPPRSSVLFPLAVTFDDWKIFDTDSRLVEDAMSPENMDHFRISRCQWLTYRRGFIEELNLTPAALHDHGFRLFARNPIRYVEIHEGAILDSYGNLNLPSNVPKELRDRIMARLPTEGSLDAVSERYVLDIISQESMRYWTKRRDVDLF